MNCIAGKKTSVALAVFLTGCPSLKTDLPSLIEARDGYVVLRASQLPVYTYLGDRPGVSRCTGTCLTFFKPIAPSESGVGMSLAQFQRSDGASQVEYLGRPLYVSAFDYPGQPPRAHRIHEGWLLLRGQ